MERVERNQGGLPQLLHKCPGGGEVREDEACPEGEGEIKVTPADQLPEDMENVDENMEKLMKKDVENPTNTEDTICHGSGEATVSTHQQRRTR